MTDSWTKKNADPRTIVRRLVERCLKTNIQDEVLDKLIKVNSDLFTKQNVTGGGVKILWRKREFYTKIENIIQSLNKEFVFDCGDHKNCKGYCLKHTTTNMDEDAFYDKSRNKKKKNLKNQRNTQKYDDLKCDNNNGFKVNTSITTTNTSHPASTPNAANSILFDNNDSNLCDNNESKSIPTPSSIDNVNLYIDDNNNNNCNGFAFDASDTNTNTDNMNNNNINTNISSSTSTIFAINNNENMNTNIYQNKIVSQTATPKYDGLKSHQIQPIHHQQQQQKYAQTLRDNNNNYNGFALDALNTNNTNTDNMNMNTNISSSTSTIPIFASNNNENINYMNNNKYQQESNHVIDDEYLLTHNALRTDQYISMQETQKMNNNNSNLALFVDDNKIKQITLNEMVGYEREWKVLKSKHGDISDDLLMEYLTENHHKDKMKIAAVLCLIDEWPRDYYKKMEYIAVRYLLDETGDGKIPLVLPTSLTIQALKQTAIEQAKQLHDQ